MYFFRWLENIILHGHKVQWDTQINFLIMPRNTINVIWLRDNITILESPKLY